MKKSHPHYWINKTGAGMLVAAVLATGFWLIIPAPGQATREWSTSPEVAVAYDLSWYTVDGGGVTFSESADGQYELSGTIGQPDAGGPLSGPPGSGYELTGGFWFALAPGDCNSDGGVTLFDYDAFESCLAGPHGGSLTPDCKCFDLDGDGDVDLRDFRDFALGFSGS